MKIGFDNEKYLQTQSAKIKERIRNFGGKLYLEFGGKLFDDFHASRVLPGFEPDSKIRMLAQIRDDVEVVTVINANDIEKNKVRGDIGITYDLDVLRLIDAFRHEQKRGVKAGYAKFETFPIWNLALHHPVNLAYEAATADLNDVNIIDPFHLDAYGETTVNYNRDVEVFPVLKAIFQKIYGESPYNSPTDMGVNMAGNCIFDDEAVRAAANREIIRRYYNELCQIRKGSGSEEDANRLELIMQKAGLTKADRPVVAAANEKAEITGNPAAAIELPDGQIVTGKTSDLLGASSAMLLNALKVLAGLDDEVKLISPNVIRPIQHLKVEHFGNKNPHLHINEILIALTISAESDPVAEAAMEQLVKLKGCEAHSSVILSAVDERSFKQLGINLTCEAQYSTNKLYHK